MGTVDDESRTRTNCSFVREKRNFVVRRGNSARSQSNLLLPRSRAAFSETRIRKGWRGREGSELSSVHRPGQRGSGKSTGGRSLTKFFRRNRSSTHASVHAHTHTHFQRRSRRDYLSGKFNYFASAERRYPISRRTAEIARKSAFRNHYRGRSNLFRAGNESKYLLDRFVVGSSWKKNRSYIRTYAINFIKGGESLDRRTNPRGAYPCSSTVTIELSLTLLVEEENLS